MNSLNIKYIQVSWRVAWIPKKTFQKKILSRSANIGFIQPHNTIKSFKQNLELAVCYRSFQSKMDRPPH